MFSKYYNILIHGGSKLIVVASSLIEFNTNTTLSSFTIVRLEVESYYNIIYRTDSCLNNEFRLIRLNRLEFYFLIIPTKSGIYKPVITS